MKRFIKKVATPILTGLLVIMATLFSFSAPLAPKASSETDETTYYLLTDHLGSVDVVLDESGNVVERRDYLPYGSERLTDEQPGAPETEHGFTGKELDDETGLSYYGARYYDSESGRFVQTDPLLMAVDQMSPEKRNAFLSDPQNLNAYAYVHNNPVVYTDPTGQYKKDVHYDLTYRLANMAGLTANQSKMVAYRDQYMDENLETTPFNGWHPFKSLQNLNSGVTAYYHFATREDALARIEAALENASSSEFGDALHTYQDTYSHGGLTPEEHQDLRDTPDLTYLDQGKALQMAKQSFFLLRKLQATTNGMAGLTPAQYRRQSVEIWNNNSDEISEYLWSEDKTGTTIETEARAAEEEDD